MVGHGISCPLVFGMRLVPLKGQMAFDETETDQALDLGRMQSLLGFPCVLEAANIHYAGPKLKR